MQDNRGQVTNMNDRRIGIIGGMGPEASADFYMKITKRTKVEKDQDHFHVIVDSNPKIPDRTGAILYGGPSPVPEIIKTARRLGQMDVDVACIPCMTSHYFFEEIQAAVDYPILNVISETAAYIASHFPAVSKVGVLATSGTVAMKIFDKYLTDVDVIYPSPGTQEGQVMEAIYGKKGIKAGFLEGFPVAQLVTASEELEEKGAELIIMGCTEIGLALQQHHVSLPLVDPLEVAIQRLIGKDDF